MADLFHMPRADAFDGSGNPRAGAKLYFYAAGTSTPQSVYTDQDLSIAHANPVVADANGVWAGIWLQDLDYKVILKDSADVTIWTQDNVHGPSFQGVAEVDDSSPYQFIGGLLVTQSATDPNNDIDIAPGAARDDANTITITLLTGLTKRLDVAWAAGTNEGGLFTGTKAANSTYYVWLIRNTATGAAEAGYDLSSSNPSLPTGYTTKRRIASLKTDASGNISHIVPWVHDLENRNTPLLTAGGTANAITATPFPALSAYYSGYAVELKPTADNTSTTVTLAVSGLTATAVKKFTSAGIVDPAVGDIQQDGIYRFVYDSAGPRFVMTNAIYQAPAPTAYFLRQITRFTSSGTYTKASWVRAVRVKVQAPGGGGGGANSTTGEGAAGGGGGGGYSEKFILAASIGSTETVTVGAQGTQGATSGGSGGSGGTTSFGAHCQATGGGGGPSIATASAFGIVVGGVGGSASSGDLNIAGQGGGFGIRSTTFSAGGVGGSSVMGGGARTASLGADTGLTGGQYGGGGSGASSYNEDDRAGGLGGQGIVIVEEFE